MVGGRTTPFATLRDVPPSSGKPGKLANMFRQYLATQVCFPAVDANLCIALAGIDDTTGRTLFCQRLCPGHISRFFRMA